MSWKLIKRHCGLGSERQAKSASSEHKKQIIAPLSLRPSLSMSPSWRKTDVREKRMKAQASVPRKAYLLKMPRPRPGQEEKHSHVSRHRPPPQTGMITLPTPKPLGRRFCFVFLRLSCSPCRQESTSAVREIPEALRPHEGKNKVKETQERRGQKRDFLRLFD